MAILKIARMGQPVLRRPAASVPVPADDELRRLIEDMVETMHDAGGTGIAAPQVYVPKRVIVFFVEAGRARRSVAEPGADPAAEDEGISLTVLINPDYEVIGETQADDWEGCLSIPGLTGQVPRWQRIRYWGQDPDGTQIEREAAGFHARVVQHEIDHLNGVLYPDRMRRLDTLIFTSEIDSYLDEDTGA